MKYTEATYNRPDGERVIDASYVLADVNIATMQLVNEDAWEKNDRNGITLFKTDDVTSVLICLQAGADTTENTVNGTVIIQVIEGEVSVSLKDDVFTLATGQMILVHENVKHGIRAVDDSVILLTNHAKHA